MKEKKRYLKEAIKDLIKELIEEHESNIVYRNKNIDEARDDLSNNPSEDIVKWLNDYIRRQQREKFQSAAEKIKLKEILEILD